MFPVHRELWAAMMSACEPQTRATSSIATTRATASSRHLRTPRESPCPGSRAPPSSRWSLSETRPSCRRGPRPAGSPSPRSPARSDESSRVREIGRTPSIRLGPGKAGWLLGLRPDGLRSSPPSISHGGEDLAALFQHVNERIPLSGDVLDDVRIPSFAVHLRHPRAALFVRECSERRTRERPAVQHDEDRCEVQVRLREPVVLQLPHVPIDELPLRRALDEERHIEPQAIPDRDEVPRGLKNPLLEDHLNQLLLPPLPLRDHLQRTHRHEVVREGLILGGHDPVLLWVVPGRLHVEVVKGQEDPVRLIERPEGA